MECFFFNLGRGCITYVKNYSRVSYFSVLFISFLKGGPVLYPQLYYLTPPAPPSPSPPCTFVFLRHCDVILQPTKFRKATLESSTKCKIIKIRFLGCLSAHIFFWKDKNWFYFDYFVLLKTISMKENIVFENHVQLDKIMFKLKTISMAKHNFCKPFLVRQNKVKVSLFVQCSYTLG